MTGKTAVIAAVAQGGYPCRLGWIRAVCFDEVVVEKRAERVRLCPGEHCLTRGCAYRQRRIGVFKEQSLLRKRVDTGSLYRTDPGVSNTVVTELIAQEKEYVRFVHKISFLPFY